MCNIHLKFYAYENKINPTRAEKKFLYSLRRGKLSGLRWKTQFIIGDYIVDFKCCQFPLIIELDGKHHLNNPRQIIYDIERTKYLNSRGYEVLRFNNERILNSNIQILDEIEKKLVDMGYVPLSPRVFKPKKNRKKTHPQIIGIFGIIR